MENSMAVPLAERRGVEEMTEARMERLIDAYGNSLLRLCTLYLRDPYMAEDAVQDTYLKVWKSYQGFQGRSAEKTWITRIAINTCKNYLSSSWRQHVELADVTEILEAGLGASRTTYGSDEYESLGNTMILMNEIMKLKDKYRLAILLYYYQELTVPEIARVLGRQESTVYILLKRGREQLKRNLPEEIREVL